MKLFGASWLITCDDSFNIIENGAIIYTDKIIEVGTFEELKDKYEYEQITQPKPNSIILPGLINTHIHLEFSANKTTLEYGNFMNWLGSVIKNREELISKLDSKLLTRTIKSLLKSGTTTIGAISSYSYELEVLKNSKINTVFFNEALGSKADMIDTLLADFKSRFEQSKKLKSKNFFPSIAIHSPYSAHPFLIREVLKLAKDNDCAISAHFMESPEERDWIDKSSGGFTNFFKNFLNQDKAVTTSNEFINGFKYNDNISFTHCAVANDDELNQIAKQNISINHCPRSNRILNNNKLDIKKAKELGINLTLGTDGLSSNISLSLFDEMRYALFVHENIEINELSKELLLMATKNGAKALNLPKGEIVALNDADFIVCSFDEQLTKENLVTQLILHTKFVDKTIIQGEEIE